MNAIKNSFRYLKEYWGVRKKINPNYLKHSDYSIPKYHNWKEFYPNIEDHISNALDTVDPKALSVTFISFKVADHKYDILTQKSVTGILLLINDTTVKCISKR